MAPRHLLEELARGGKLLCPETKVPVAVIGDRIVSDDGREFGRLPGPLNFLRSCQETLDPGRVPATEIARVRTHLELPVGDAIDAEIAKAIAATGARFPDAHLSAEARILAERFCMSPFQLGVDAPQPSAPVGRPASALGGLLGIGAREGSRLEHVSNTVGERLTAGQEVFRSVRVRNRGNGPLRCDDPVVRVETRCTTTDGLPVPGTAVLNELPADIDPDREITLILRICAPAESGRYMLQVRLLANGVAGEPILTMPIQAIACELPIFGYAYHPELLEYGPDHHVAAVEALDFMKHRYAGKSLAVLEIGGGVHPTGHSIAAHGHRVVSSDISHSQSILGTLFFKHKMPSLSESLAFISCDGTELPFGDGAFDGVVLFAAFHHFAEPFALLEEMQRVTVPGGFIFLGCENCAPNPADPQYREELRRGINEQMWTLAEYTDFFRRARLEVARARVDRHSLKVALVRT